MTEPIAATPLPAATSPAISPQLEFTATRNRLLELEKIKQSGGSIDLREVQRLVSRSAELIALIQTSTTGPKKKAPALDAEGNVKVPRAKKAAKPSTIAHIAVADSFDDL